MDIRQGNTYFISLFMIQLDVTEDFKQHLRSNQPNLLLCEKCHSNTENICSHIKFAHQRRMFSSRSATMLLRKSSIATHLA